MHAWLGSDTVIHGQYDDDAKACGHEAYEIIECLATVEHENSLIRLFSRKYAMDEEIARKLARIPVPGKYLHVSEKALRRLLIHMRKTGKSVRECADMAGLTEKTGYEHTENEKLWRCIPDFRNPTVTRAVTEVRGVLRMLIDKYGQPDTVRIELSRDMKNAEKERKKKEEYQKKREKMREDAKKILEESGVSSTDDAVLRYILWQECQQMCPYTGTKLSFERVFRSSDVDVEHIIPYSRCLDDSFLNKTLCIGSFNRETKRERAPAELRATLGDDWFVDMANRVGNLTHMPRAKKTRFFRDVLESDVFVERQLNDTRYISREIKQFAEALLGKNRVQITKGGLTGKLRYHWGWNTFLNEQ